MAADHEHGSRQRRGLLCNLCNMLEGMHMKVPLDEEEWGRRVKAYRARSW